MDFWQASIIFCGVSDPGDLGQTVKGIWLGP